MTETTENSNILTSKQNIFNFFTFKEFKGKMLDVNIDDFISQNKAVFEKKLSNIINSKSDNEIENNIRDFFKKNKKGYSISIKNASIIFLILLIKNELTGPEFKVFYGDYMSESSFKKISYIIDDNDNSILTKFPSTQNSKTTVYSLNANFEKYVKRLLNDQLFDNSKAEIIFQLNSYRQLPEPSINKIDLDFYPILDKDGSIIDKWTEIYDKIKKVRYDYNRTGQKQPQFIFDTNPTHGAIAFIIGYHLYKFTPKIFQFNKSKRANEYWSIIPPNNNLDYHEHWKIEKLDSKDHKDNSEIILIINISSSIKGGVQEFALHNNLDLPIYNLTVKSGVRNSVIKDNQDANNKLHSLIQLIEELKSKFFIKHVHLFYKGPFAFSCMLGDSIRNKFIISLYQRKLKYDDFYFAIELGNYDQ